MDTPETPSNPTQELKARMLEAEVIEVLKTIYDPEIPVSIYDMGLIYSVQADAEGKVHIQMTLTVPGCPVAVSLPEEVRYRVASIPGVKECEVEVVWDPPWDPSRMSESARLELGFF
jgi:FeS assembly SUF system protein